MTEKIYTLEDCIRDIGEIPYCQCGCGKKVNVFTRYYLVYKRKGYPKHLQGHNSVGKSPWNLGLTKETDPIVKESGEKTSEKLIEWFKTHESPRLGCHHTPEAIEKNRKSNLGKETWNKGTKGICKPNSGSFGNGKIPWNKGLTKETDERVKRNAENNIKSHIGKINDGCGNNFGTGDYYTTPNQGSVFMRSSWELKYAQHLDKNKIDYLYEPYSFKMIISINGIEKETTYRPDFYLVDENKFIEIKGYFRDETSKLKSYKFIELYSKDYNYEILMKEELKDLGIKF